MIYSRFTQNNTMPLLCSICCQIYLALFSFFNLHKQVEPHAFLKFQSQAPDPGLGGLKIGGRIYQFCAITTGFPTIGASFERRND